MNFKETLLFLFLLLLPFVVSANDPKELKLVTFNMRYDGNDDGPNKWIYRKDWIGNYINFYQFDVVGTQELLDHQLKDVLLACPQYKSIGVAREDGGVEGEYSAILYNASVLEVVSHHTFSLSKHPQEFGRRDWGAACARICTWAEFRIKDDSTTLFVFNTHFDHVSTRARNKSVHLILDSIARLAYDKPVVFMGDLNSTPQSRVYKVLSTTAVLKDSKSEALAKYGPAWTFNGFGRGEVDELCLDYIFVNSKVCVHSYLVDAQRRKDLFISDHYPVSVSISF